MRDGPSAVRTSSQSCRRTGFLCRHRRNLSGNFFDIVDHRRARARRFEPIRCLRVEFRCRFRNETEPFFLFCAPCQRRWFPRKKDSRRNPVLVFVVYAKILLFQSTRRKVPRDIPIIIHGAQFCQSTRVMELLLIRSMILLTVCILIKDWISCPNVSKFFSSLIGRLLHSVNRSSFIGR